MFIGGSLFGEFDASPDVLFLKWTL